MQVLPRCLNHDPGLTLTHFTRRSNLGKSEKYLMETIAVLGLKIAESIQLNELKKLSEYQRSRLFFDLGQRSLRFQSYILKQKQLGDLEPKLI